MMKALRREYYDQGFLLLTCAGSFRSTTPIVLFESPAGLYATSSNNPRRQQRCLALKGYYWEVS